MKYLNGKVFFTERSASLREGDLLFLWRSPEEHSLSRSPTAGNSGKLASDAINN
jgi:hypothetical protein